MKGEKARALACPLNDHRHPILDHFGQRCWNENITWFAFADLDQCCAVTF